MRPVCMEKDGSKAREGRNLTGFNRRATRLGGMQQPSNPEVILAQPLSGSQLPAPFHGSPGNFAISASCTIFAAVMGS